ncbi:MAG: SHOCT domain-containing protein [Proteobacteria bacterium]|nr:SHOCT domain-containing protein [Pseudomonadota bacterium]
MKYLFTTVLIFSVIACTSVQVQELDANYQVYHVCIEKNPAVTVQGFEKVIEEGFERHGITTEIYNGNKPSHCEYRLTYTALRSWDFVTYLSHAELDLYKNNKKIAYAEYHLNGKGGFALNKWAGVDSKMDPVINQLLSGYSSEMVDAHRKTIPSNDTHKQAISDTEKLKILKEWFDQGLISEQEYKHEKQKIMSQ